MAISNNHEMDLRDSNLIVLYYRQNYTFDP